MDKNDVAEDLREFPADLSVGADGDSGRAWALLYRLYGELPIPERDGWKIAAMYLRLEAENAALRQKLVAMSAPVRDDEWEGGSSAREVGYRAYFDYIIAARSEAAG